ncbi:hypothetical protein Tco_1572057, partial [Tanacetum coccineum]
KIIAKYETGCGVSGHANLLSTLISLTAHDDVEVGKLTDIEIKAFLLGK